MLRREGRGWKIEDRRSRLFFVELAFAILHLRFSILRFSAILHPPCSILDFSSMLHPPSSIVVFFLALTALSACRQQMANQPYHQPLEASDFFRDGMASRPPPAGTIPHRADQDSGSPDDDQAIAKSVNDFPVPLTMPLLTRGQERYNIYCSPCHDRTGSGEGMVVQRGFTKARSFHSSELRAAPVGHFFAVMTNGFGAMPSYAHAITPADRWAVAAYIRALQLSRHAPVADLASEDRDKLREIQ